MPASAQTSNLAMHSLRHVRKHPQGATRAPDQLIRADIARVLGGGRAAQIETDPERAAFADSSRSLNGDGRQRRAIQMRLRLPRTDTSTVALGSVDLVHA